MDRLSNVLFGGYDKVDTLQYIDLLTTRIYELETVLENKKNAKAYAMPLPVPKPNIKSTALGGFDKNDVDSYVSELLTKINELIVKIGEEP